MKIFGREPVYILALVAIVLKLAAAFGWDVSDTQQAYINAALAAAVGVVSAIVLKTGAAGAAVIQVGQAALALFVGFGLHLSADQQALLMSTLAAIVALVLHREVTAPVPVVGLEQTSPVEPTAPRVVAEP
ncbi:hypothetical protein ABZX65_26565 [Streptomyces sp. NPDC003300]|uniref:hypothetical protein n=1 Tax=unclassified Streptomyces TaxID=2593676 RepID=UPI0033BAD88C